MKLKEALKKTNAKDTDLVFCINYPRMKDMAKLLNSKIDENKKKISDAHIFISTAKEANKIADNFDIEIVEIMDGMGATRQVVSNELHTFVTNFDELTERHIKKEVSKMIETSF